MRFDLLTVDLFVTVCEEPSILRAAERRNIGASAISKRIQIWSSGARMQMRETFPDIRYVMGLYVVILLPLTFMPAISLWLPGVVYG
jgi:hypothetical protein